MAAVDEALADFSDALVERAATVAPVVGRVGAETLGFARSPDATQDSHMKDLGLLASTIGVEALDVSDQADALVRAINDAVVDEVDGLATKGATGLSIYFPPTADLADGAYLDVDSARPWADFLTAYYDAGAAIPERELPRFTNRGGEPEVDLDDDGVTLTGTFGELAIDNLTGATISYGFLEDDGSVTYFGEESAVVDPEGSPLAVGTYDLTALTMSDGEDTAYAYLALDYQDGDDTVTLDVPLAVLRPRRRRRGDLPGRAAHDRPRRRDLRPGQRDLLRLRHRVGQLRRADRQARRHHRPDGAQRRRRRRGDLGARRRHRSLRRPRRARARLRGRPLRHRALAGPHRLRLRRQQQHAQHRRRGAVAVG